MSEENKDSQITDIVPDSPITPANPEEVLAQAPEKFAPINDGSPAAPPHESNPDAPEARHAKRGRLAATAMAAGALALFAVSPAVGGESERSASVRAKESRPLIEAPVAIMAERKTRPRFTRVPKVHPGESLPEAKQDLRKAGLRPAVRRINDYPNADRGKKFVVAGLARRVTRRIRRSGETVKKVVYKPLRAGTRLPRRTKAYINPKQVSVNTAPTSPKYQAPNAPTPTIAKPPPQPPVETEPAPGENLPPTEPTPPPPVSPPEETKPQPTPPQETTPSPPPPTQTPPQETEQKPTPPPPEPSPSEPTPTQPPPVTEQPPAEQPPTTPEKPALIDLKAEVEKHLKSETVYLPFMHGCSGFLIRDPNNGNQIVGVRSAQHCGLRPEQRPRERDSKGNLFIRVNTLKVEQGEDLNNLSTIAEADQVIVPKPGDMERDSAIVVLKGFTADQVLAADKATRMSEADVYALKNGQQAYMSGYPLAQPNNTSGVIRRQSLSLTVLGKGLIYTTNRQTIQTLITGVKANADGAICSYGGSGAGGITAYAETTSSGTQKAVIRYLGDLVGFDVIKDNPALEAEREAQWNTQLDGYDAACAFEPRTADRSTHDIVKLVVN